MSGHDPTKLQSVASSPELLELIPSEHHDELLQIDTVDLEQFNSPRGWSFISKALKVIVGNDDREEADTANFPYRAIVKLIIRHGHGIVEHGTGFLVSPTCIITAGHCVHKYGQWTSQVDIHSKIGSSNLSVRSTRFLSVNGWLNGYDERYDYGAIILNHRGLYDHVKGSLGAKALSADVNAVEVAGYPIDGWQMLKSSGRVMRRDIKVEHDVDTYWGNSGSPLLCKSSGLVVGVHTSGDEAKQTNYAIAVWPEVLSVWSKWSQVRDQQNQPI